MVICPSLAKSNCLFFPPYLLRTNSNNDNNNIECHVIKIHSEPGTVQSAQLSNLSYLFVTSIPGDMFYPLNFASESN